jgi:hypothetical protein
MGLSIAKAKRVNPDIPSEALSKRVHYAWFLLRDEGHDDLRSPSFELVNNEDPGLARTSRGSSLAAVNRNMGVRGG